MTMSNNVIIYTNDNCPYCVMAKRTFERLNVLYTEKKVGADVTREELLEAVPGARTVPQIIINSEVIGGYAELASYIENTGFNGTGYTL